MFTSNVDLMISYDFSYIGRIGKILSAEFTNRYKKLLPYDSRLFVYPIDIYETDLTTKDLTEKVEKFIHVELISKDAYRRGIAGVTVCTIPASYFKNNVIIEKSPKEFKTVLKCSDEFDSFIKGGLGITPYARDNN